MVIHPSKKDMTMFNVAKEMSNLSDHPQHHLGCVVVDKHRIISSGYNSSKTHPIQKTIDDRRFGCDCAGKVHAETSALIPLIKQGYDLSNASIYIYREHKNGKLAMSKPCPGCMSLINLVGIKKIFYTIENGFAKEKNV